jgi:hypothetical protein
MLSSFQNLRYKGLKKIEGRLIIGVAKSLNRKQGLNIKETLEKGIALPLLHELILASRALSMLTSILIEQPNQANE